jgi:hypothetical protein
LPGTGKRAKSPELPIRPKEGRCADVGVVSLVGGSPEGVVDMLVSFRQAA